MDRFSYIQDKWYDTQVENHWSKVPVLNKITLNITFLLYFIKKDFISNIKGSLLTSDLYEDWLTVMDEGTLFGRITAIQR